MEFDRRVQIRVRKPGTGKRSFGSGYLIAPRLVLTAAHVLDGMNDAGGNPLTVSQPDAGGQEFPAIVYWHPADETVDAALIEISGGHGWQTPESLSDLLTRPPQRFGLIIGARPHPITLTGFPRMQKDPDDGRRLDEQLTGHIVPGSGSLAGRYEISSSDPTLPAAPPPGSEGSRWSGISGAALLGDDVPGGDMLCGVVGRDRQADSGTRLTATTAARLLADDTFRAAVAQHTGWEPVLEPVEAAGLLTPAAAGRDLNSPAALLRADAEAVAFHGRDSELTDLRTWCQEGPPTLAVRVLTGPGGQGKTRLARHLTNLLSHHGWVAGHLRPDLTDYDTPPDFTPLTTALPLLVVVDYAETRPRLLRRLISHLHYSRHRVRLLLLARSDGEWRTDPLNAASAVRSLLAAAPVTALAPLIPRSRPTQDRRIAFASAAHGLACLLPRISTVPAHDWTALAAALHPPDDLSDSRYDNALTLQLTALVTLLQHGPKPTDIPPGTPAEEILLQHEGRFWEDSARAPAFKLNLPTTTLAAAVAAAALTGAASKDEAAHVISTIPDLPADKAVRTAAWLARLYPAEPDRYWGSLQPDRIAEYHASRTLTHGSILLPALLATAAPGQQAQLITILARAAIAHYNAGRTNDSEQVLSTMDTALDTAPLAYQAIQTTAAALPYPSRVICPLAIRLTTTLAHTNQELAAANPAARQPELARSLSNLGNRLSEAGCRDEALTATEEAVKIYRRLADSSPAAYEPELASSLSNLSVDLSQAGRRSEALTVVEEAVEIRRRLTADNPAAHEPELARSLSNLGNRLSEAGRRDEALTATEEAVKIYRQLAAANPAAYEPELARSLSNLGADLTEAGHRTEARAATEEAVKIYRQLAATNPAAHKPDLAASLSNLGNRLSRAGHRGEALTVAKEATEIYRQLAADNPAAYGPDLARLLQFLAPLLAVEGDPSGALGATEEAVELYHSHIATMPSALPPLHPVLNLQTKLLEALRREEEIEEVRRWFRENPLPPDSHS
ncbi:tetratricopeptide repeat protein [Streptomyces sp. NPDC093510]|uniref:tetratricopeptide repeat protein n=1 Tax=Streptomyces sp. NPDC093510 TaxID=3155199 RepID=UPI003436ADAE